MSRTVLVTGSDGFVGRHVVALVEAAGDEVRPLPHRVPDAELARLVPGVTDCIHLGWYAGPSDYLVNTRRNLDSLGASVALVEALVAAGVHHLVAVGSSAEYQASHLDLDEDMPVAPWSPYGAAKAALHLLLQTTLGADLAVAWTRPFNVIGPGEHPSRILPAVAEAVVAGRPIALSAGEQERDYIDVEDVAAALVGLSRAGTTGTFNVSTGEGTALRDVLRGLADRLGDAGLLRFGARPYGPHDPMRAVGRNDRLVAATGWTRRHRLDDTLDRIAATWRP